MTRIVGKRENMALTMEQRSITSGSLYNEMGMTGDKIKRICLLKMIITASLHHGKWDMKFSFLQNNGKWVKCWLTEKMKGVVLIFRKRPQGIKDQSV